MLFPVGRRGCCTTHNGNKQRVSGERGSVLQPEFGMTPMAGRDYCLSRPAAVHTNGAALSLGLSSTGVHTLAGCTAGVILICLGFMYGLGFSHVIFTSNEFSTSRRLGLTAKYVLRGRGSGLERNTRELIAALRRFSIDLKS